MGKTLGTRQKLNFRIEPSQRNVKPGSPLPSLPVSNKTALPPTKARQQKKTETAPGQTPETKAT